MPTPDSSPSDNPLLPPLLDAVELFNALNIPYALVGGIAAMLYGRARFTEDVDFVAAPGHESILAANPDIMRDLHFDPACIWKLYHNSGVEIDIWKDQYAGEIVARAKELGLNQYIIRIADVHDLVAMKLRAARFQDDYDISEILQATQLDEGLLQNRVSPPQFQHFLNIRNRVHPA